jgi:hypothetical protein
MQSQLSTLPVPTSSLFWKGGAIDALEAGQGDSSRAVHGVQFHLAYIEMGRFAQRPVNT